MDQLTITLDDADGQLQLPPRGARLTVLIGWKGEPLTEKGTYIVDEIAHEGPPGQADYFKPEAQIFGMNLTLNVRCPGMM